LFATLDPTVRKVAIPGGNAVLADTVGFVRDLPHELVAAFRSTLSEAREADLLLHVIDAADPLRDERIRQVDEVLEEIGAGDIPQLLVYNKIDRIPGSFDSDGSAPDARLEGIDTAQDKRLDGNDPARPERSEAESKDPAGTPVPQRPIQPRHDTPTEGRERVWISARDGLGIELLREALGTRFGLRRIQAEVSLPPAAGRLRARLYQLDAVRGERHDEHGWTLELDIAESDAQRLAAQDDGAALRPLLPAGEAAWTATR